MTVSHMLLVAALRAWGGVFTSCGAAWMIQSLVQWNL